MTSTVGVTIGRRSPPRVLLLPLTMRCNARCTMCTIWKADPVSFTPELLAKAFGDGVLGSGLEFLGLTGGEPTTLKHFDDLAALALDASPNLHEVSYNTNGFAPDVAKRSVERLLDRTERRGIRLRLYVSLDGVGTIHDAVRGVPGVFSRTVRTIARLKELSLSRNCDLSINSVVTCLNADVLEETLRFAQGLDVPINVSLAMHTDVCINSAESDVAFEIRPDQVPHLRKILTRLRVLGRIRRGSPLEMQYLDHLLTMLDGLPRTLPCPFAQSAGCLIDPWGDVYPCGVSRSLLMGNVKDRPFGDIWYDVETRSRVRSSLPAFCSQCESNCFVHAADDLEMKVHQ